jgi:hypothetical protein
VFASATFIAACAITPTSAPVPTFIPIFQTTASSTPQFDATPTAVLETAVPTTLAPTFTLSINEDTRAIPRYNRNQWKHWIDKDGDCHNTRAEVLLDEAVGPVTLEGCRVMFGEWIGLYTGMPVTEASVLDVDHMVPLANAHRSGGWAWNASRKEAYANDLRDSEHLIAVTASENRSKGAKGPEYWRPPNVNYWCDYATNWARIKDIWDLSVTPAELVAVRDMLGDCSSRVQIFVPTNPILLPELPPTTTLADMNGALLYDPFGPDLDCGDFRWWMEAQAFYEAAGGPAIDRHRLDGDRDGVACASLIGAP